MKPENERIVGIDIRQFIEISKSDISNARVIVR